VSECKGLLHQVRGYGKSISLGNHVLKLACIFAIDSIIQYLTQKRCKMIRCQLSNGMVTPVFFAAILIATPG
jgi:hypothetical protein